MGGSSLCCHPLPSISYHPSRNGVFHRQGWQQGARQKPVADGFITAAGGQRGARLLESHSYWSDLKMVYWMKGYLNSNQLVAQCSPGLW